MKYYITIKLECDVIDKDISNDIIDTAKVVGETSACGACDVLDRRRGAKINECTVEFTETVKVDI